MKNNNAGIGVSKHFFILATAVLLTLVTQNALAAKCLFISSYHQGYAWSDGVERGLRSTLADKCELKQFDMDTKRHKDEASKKKAALQAKALIESWQPDVVITADDNAAKYIIKPFYKDHALPFVFCGVNWNVDDYGFPYKNTTGIVEVAPIDEMFNKAKQVKGSIGKVLYIGADTLTEKKNLARFEKAAKKHGVSLDNRLVSSTEDWLKAYQETKNYDFIAIGSKSGINDWDDAKIRASVNSTPGILSLTNHGWMMPYSLMGLTKVPEEHGEWAAEAALAILQGANPIDIPIVSNRKWDLWVNRTILNQSGIKLSESWIRKAKKID